MRGGANFFSYADTFSPDGITYDATLALRSGEASLDWFPGAKGFHLSPGALIYDGNKLSGNAGVPSGQSFTLNGTDYTSSATSPVTGTAGLTFNKFAPKLTAGFGNLIPRSGRHFSVPLELGFAYVGDPKSCHEFDRDSLLKQLSGVELRERCDRSADSGEYRCAGSEVPERCGRCEDSADLFGGRGI